MAADHVLAVENDDDYLLGMVKLYLEIEKEQVSCCFRFSFNKQIRVRKILIFEQVSFVSVGWPHI